jgi:hypothetical protein
MNTKHLCLPTSFEGLRISDVTGSNEGDALLAERRVSVYRGTPIRVYRLGSGSGDGHVIAGSASYIEDAGGVLGVQRLCAGSVVATACLEATASKVGGRTLMRDPKGCRTLPQSIGDPSTRFTVSLDGFSGSSIHLQVMEAASRGATPTGKLSEWEVAQLYQGGRLGDVTFMRGGPAVPNPWAP